jgi:hypothetical protein
MSPSAVQNSTGSRGIAPGRLLAAATRWVPLLVPFVVPVDHDVNNLVVSAECDQLGWLSPRIRELQ